MKLDALLMGLVGAALGLAVGTWVAQRPALGAQADPAVARALADVCTRLEAISASLSDLPPPSSAPASQQAEPSTGSRYELIRTEELLEALHSLESAVRAQASGSAPGDERARTAPAFRKNEPQPANYAVIQDVRGRLEPGALVADPELFGLSPEQAYRRFGTPDRFGNSADRVRWIYEDPANHGRFTLIFVDGYLAWVQNEVAD